MEHVLDVYQQAPNSDEPLICMDETTKQLTREEIEPLPCKPGQPSRYDTLYRRNGVAVVFMFFAPHLGWRRVEIAESKTRLDWAHAIRRLLEVDYRDARKIHLVLDNLNTHNGASLYEAFAPDQAHHLMQRIEFHYTPKHGSWLNMAEIELSVLSRQCLGRRIADLQTLQTQTDAWQTRRNNEQIGANWQFKTEDARLRLKKLYPTL
jgi:hypothetical protein